MSEVDSTDTQRTTDERTFLREVAEHIERIACWVDRDAVYREVRELRDRIYARNQQPKQRDWRLDLRPPDNDEGLS